MRLIPAALYLARGGLTFADIREVFPPAKAIAADSDEAAPLFRDDCAR